MCWTGSQLTWACLKSAKLTQHASWSSCWSTRWFAWMLGQCVFSLHEYPVIACAFHGVQMQHPSTQTIQLNAFCFRMGCHCIIFLSRSVKTRCCGIMGNAFKRQALAQHNRIYNMLRSLSLKGLETGKSQFSDVETSWNKVLLSSPSKTEIMWEASTEVQTSLFRCSSSAPQRQMHHRWKSMRGPSHPCRGSPSGCKTKERPNRISERSENPCLFTSLEWAGHFVRCSNTGFSWHNLPNKNLWVLAIVADLADITAGNCEVWLLPEFTNCHAARVLQRIHAARLAAADGAGCSLAFLARVLLAVSQQSQQHMTYLWDNREKRKTIEQYLPTDSHHIPPYKTPESSWSRSLTLREVSAAVQTSLFRCSSSTPQRQMHHRWKSMRGPSHPCRGSPSGCKTKERPNRISERSENPCLFTSLEWAGHFVRCSNTGFSWHNLPNKNLWVLAIVADLADITAGNCEVWLLPEFTNCHAARVLQRIHAARLAAADGAGCSLAFLARVLLAVSQQSQQHMTYLWDNREKRKTIEQYLPTDSHHIPPYKTPESSWSRSLTLREVLSHAAKRVEATATSWQFGGRKVQ